MRSIQVPATGRSQFKANFKAACAGMHADGACGTLSTQVNKINKKEVPLDIKITSKQHSASDPSSKEKAALP